MDRISGPLIKSRIRGPSWGYPDNYPLYRHLRLPATRRKDPAAMWRLEDTVLGSASINYY